MAELQWLELGEAIKDVFVAGDRYKLDKYVPAFSVDGKFLGDCFNYTMVEPLGDEPPIFYHVYSPYDVISQKAPQRALVFKAGELVLDTDITDYVRQRTAVMDALLLQALRVPSLGRVLYIGSGKIARSAVQALKAYYPSLQAVDFINTRGQDEEFVTAARAVGVTATPGSLEQLGQYDVIICHSSAKQPVLTAPLRERIKPGAIIASFVSEDFYEVAEEYYDTSHANVIIDWDQTILEAPELERAVERKLADPDKLLRLKDVLAGTANLDPAKAYTMYRSHGTPMQNLAVLKLLMKSA